MKCTGIPRRIQFLSSALIRKKEKDVRTSQRLHRVARRIQNHFCKYFSINYHPLHLPYTLGYACFAKYLLIPLLRMFARGKAVCVCGQRPTAGRRPHHQYPSAVMCGLPSSPRSVAFGRERCVRSSQVPRPSPSFDRRYSSLVPSPPFP